MKMSFFFTFSFQLLIAISIIKLLYCHNEKNSKVLLISFDGFRHDYFEFAAKAGVYLKNFHHIFDIGVKTDYLKNAFIPRTFPNHMSIISGCFEESHGIIDNEFFDPLYNEQFSIRNLSQMLSSKWWSECEPIWASNIINGHHSGVFYWPGQIAPYKNNTFPTHSFGLFDKNVQLEYKIDVIISWLLHKNTNLAIVYHHEPDMTGHLYGPNSEAILQAIKHLDKSIGYLLNKIKSSQLESVLNIIIVSDHGMATILDNCQIEMDKFINPDLYYDYQKSLTFWGIWPKSSENSIEIIENLGRVSNITVYRKEEIPTEWHYSNNRRVAPIIALADEGCIISHSNTNITLKGTHGYSMATSSMRGIFLAWGPRIVARNLSKSIIRVVDVFPLIAEILKFSHIPSNNGSLSNVKWILKSNVNETGIFTTLVFISVFSLVAVLSACVIISCAHYNSNALRVQKVGNTYVLKSGNLVRKWQQNQDGIIDKKTVQSSKVKKFLNKKSKITEADAAFLLESNDEDEILGDIPTSSYKFHS